MNRRLALVAGVAGLALSGGCVNLMEQSAINQIAPEWFEEKTIEVKGEGYPELADIPQIRAFSGTPKEWQAQASDLKADAEPLEKLAAEPVSTRTAEDIRAMAAQWRALAEGTAVPQVSPDKTGQ